MSQSNKMPKTAFLVRKDYEGQKDFDKYYYEVSEIDVFKESGQVDPDTGDKLGVIEKKVVSKKIDIDEFIQSQADSVGVDAYVRALALQGESINDYNTVVSDEIDDYSKMPDTLADVMMAGDRAKAAFDAMDPALKGSHTTIEGFLNGLSQESLDAYIKARVDALVPKKEGD